MTDDGTKAISINFSAYASPVPITVTGRGQDPRADVQLPDDDGLFLMDLETEIPA